MVELNLANLEAIYQFLQETQNNADRILSDFELDNNEEPMLKKRQLLNSILDKTTEHLKEIAYIDAFLQSCDVLEINVLNPKQQVFLIECQVCCQSLRGSCKKILKKIVQIKSKSNEALRFASPYQANEHENERNVVQLYYQTRDILSEIHRELILFDSEDMISAAGRQLQVMEGRKLFLDTEHEMNVFMDFAIFQSYKNGKNIAQRYYDMHSLHYAGEILAALAAFKDTRFSFLKIIRYVREHGLIVHDPLIGKSFLMIDKGLSALAKYNKGYAILTHYSCLPKFAMTTGAPTPIILTSEVGRYMRTIFSNLIFHHQKQQLLDEKSYKQCIADLYKMAIHNDATKIVASRELPINHYQQNKEQLFIN